MAVRPFGYFADAPLPARSQRRRPRTSAEHQALDRAEARRQESKWEFEEFCARQRERFAANLSQRVARIHEARWAVVEQDATQLIAARR